MNADEEEDMNNPIKEKDLRNPFPNMNNHIIKANKNREIGETRGFNLRGRIKAFAEDELVRKGYKELKCEVPGTPRSTFLMVFSPDGTKVASTHGDHNIYVTDLRTGKNIKTLIGHPRTPWCIAFHPTSNDLVASGCLAGQVRIWDLSGGSEVWSTTKGSVISSIAFHPIDRLVVIATFHELFFWDWSKPEPFLQTSTGNIREKVRYVAFDKLGHKLITGIANCPQSRWERNRTMESSTNSYRRRVIPRSGVPCFSHHSPLVNNPPVSSERSFTSAVPERERRITACYRNLVHEYELLVHRYLQMYRPPTTMDRGTDPMDLDSQQPSTSGSSVPPSRPVTVDFQESGPSSSNTSLFTSRSSPSEIPTTSNYHSQKQTQRSTQTTVTPSRVKLFPKRKSSSGLLTSESRKRKLPEHKNSATETRESQNVSPENRELANVTEAVEGQEMSSSGNAETEAAGTSSGSYRRCLNLRAPTPSTPTTSETSESSHCNVYRMKIKCSPKQNVNEVSQTKQISERDNLVNLREKIVEIQRSLSGVIDRSESQPSTSAGNNTEQTESPKHDGIQRRLSSHLKRIYPGYLKKTNRRPVLETSSGSSSEDDERRRKRLYLHRNFSHNSARNNQNDSPVSENQEPGAATSCSPPAAASSNNSQSFKPLSFNPLLKPHCSSDNNNPDEDSSNSVAPSSSTASAPLPADSCARTTEINSRTITEPCARTLMNTDTRTTNSTVYTPSGIRRRFFSQRFSAFYPTRVYNVRSQSRLRRSSSFQSPNLIRLIDNTFDGDNNGIAANLPPDEVVNYSERANSEDDQNDQAFQPPLSEFHPFDPPPDVPSINPENIGIGNMYSNIVQDLEVSLRNVRNIRASARPGETSDMLSSFSERLESIMQQSNAILRNLRSTMDMLPQNSRTPGLGRTPNRFPLFTFNDPNFYMRENGDNSPDRNSVTIDHTYPRNPLDNLLSSPTDPTFPRNDDYSSLSPPPAQETMTPIMTSLHLTISHIQRQAGLLRRQVESIERIDRAMLEVAQLQMIRQMFEELRRHVSTVGNADSRGGVSSVRQMMAGTRISDSSPYDSPNETSTESNSLNFNSSSASNNVPTSSEQSRPSSVPPQTSRSNARKSYPPSRLQHLQRQIRRFSIVNFFPPRRVSARERYLRRRELHRSLSARTTPSRVESVTARLADDQGSAGPLTTDILNVMVRRLEQLLNEHLRLIGLPLHLQPVQMVRDNRENVVMERLNRCRLRLNNTLGRSANSNMHQNNRTEVTNASQDSMLRFGAREAMSLILNTFTRYFENTTNINFSPSFRSFVRMVIDLSLLLSDMLLLHIIDSIPPPTGMNLDPERESLSARIEQACRRMLQNRSSNQSLTLTRTLRILRLTARCSSRVLDNTYNTRRNAFTISNNHTDRVRDLTNRINHTVGFMNSFHDFLRQMPRETPETQRPERVGSVTNPIDLTNSDEDSEASFNNWGGPSNEETNNNDNSTSASNTSGETNNTSNSGPNEDLSSSNTYVNRRWNVPTVHINDVPASESVFTSWPTRMLPLRYRLSEFRSSNAPNIFRPRFFLLPPIGGVNVNPLESDVDDSQRDTLNDGDMVMAVTPNHRIQAWDISSGLIPDINDSFKNVVVSECKIHNDASVDISNDGNILVTLLPSSGYLNYSNRLGVYSLRWESLGQCLYITSFEQHAVSVSLSPLSRHLVVGLASRRMPVIPSERWTLARIFLIETKKIYGNNITVLRDIDQHRDNNFMSLNCIRWLPISGQGLIYATNTGQLTILS